MLMLASRSVRRRRVALGISNAALPATPIFTTLNAPRNTSPLCHRRQFERPEADEPLALGRWSCLIAPRQRPFRRGACGPEAKER